MVVNRFFRTLLLLLAILFTWINQSYAQHNALTVRVDTMTINAQQTDILLGVYYKLTGDKPADFYGFDARISYDTTKIRAVQVVFDGTASANLGFHIGNTNIAGEVRAVVLGQPGQDIDTTNPLLFLVRFSVLSAGFDTAYLSLFRFDVTPPMHIDTVIRQNGWLRHNIVVTPPARVPIEVSTSEAFGKSDSLIVMPILVSDLTKANVRKAQFVFSYDTSLLTFIASGAGSISGNMLMTRDSQTGTRHFVVVSNSDTNKPLIGSGELFSLRFHAKRREDTVCSELVDTAFQVLNPDAHVDSVTLRLSQICVVGTGMAKAVASTAALEDKFDARPNPFVSEISLGSTGSVPQYLEVVDVLGRRVFAALIKGAFRWQTFSLPQGTYLARLTPQMGNVLQWQSQKIRLITKIH